MKGLNVQAVSRLLLTSLCSLSFLAAPKVSADSCCAQQDNCCEQQDPCCDTGCCGSGWGRTALLVGGAIVAGGIAGAIAGNSNRGHHHHSHSGSGSGSSGPVGPTGATGPAGATGATGTNPFVLDDGAALEFTATFPATFNVTIEGTSTDEIQFTFIPFVSTPDGLIIDAKSPSIDGGVVPAGTGTQPVALDTPTVSVLVPEDTVVFGTYHFGIEVELDSPLFGATGISFDPATAAIAAVVEVSNSEGIEEIGLNPIVLPSTVLTGPTGPEDVQGETDYSYDPDLFLP